MCDALMSTRYRIAIRKSFEVKRFRGCKTKLYAQLASYILCWLLGNIRVVRQQFCILPKPIAQIISLGKFRGYQSIRLETFDYPPLTICNIATVHLLFFQVINILLCKNEKCVCQCIYMHIVKTLSVTVTACLSYQLATAN